MALEVDDRWILIDRRTNQRVGVACFSEEGAVGALAAARRNVEAGHRPDLADIIEFVEVVRRDQWEQGHD